MKRGDMIHNLQYISAKMWKSIERRRVARV